MKASTQTLQEDNDKTNCWFILLKSEMHSAILKQNLIAYTSEKFQHCRHNTKEFKLGSHSQFLWCPFD